MGSVQFLSTLRDKNPAAADQRFAALLAIAALLLATVLMPSIRKKREETFVAED